uniref:Uncharacterized protein n=1 Tax=Romanomermis culicivorax TaxID=13658 RepID=A0A915IWL0_ROMCU
MEEWSSDGIVDSVVYFCFIFTVIAIDIDRCIFGRIPKYLLFVDCKTFLLLTIMFVFFIFFASSTLDTRSSSSHRYFKEKSDAVIRRSRPPRNGKKQQQFLTKTGEPSENRSTNRKIGSNMIRYCRIMLEHIE